MFRDAPIQYAVLVVVPVVVAIGQLGNSFYTDLSFMISIPFAAVLIGFTALSLQYNLARFRREQLERELLRRA